MIALPGLTLVTGRYNIARQILEAYSERLDQGLLPNRFPDAGETPEYNTADATLWFIEAIRAFLHYSGDEEFVRERLYPKLKDIIDWHVRGTRYGIHVDSDGLLACGEPGVQLTWMDAKVGEEVVTPRCGKPVEVQALWYNALQIMADFARRFGDPSAEALFDGLADEAKECLQYALLESARPDVSTMWSKTGTPTVPCAPTRSLPSAFRIACCRPKKPAPSCRQCRMNS